MTAPRYDFHVHTHYLGCANETMQVSAIIQECERLGVRAMGITDHLNRPDQVGLHRAIRDDILRLQTNMDVYFGVELNFTGMDQGFVYDESIRDEIGFQFAIGGIHATYLESYDTERMIEIQHRHHLKTCADPMVQVLVHPYWFSKGEFDRNRWPWFDTMRLVPRAFARELGQASRDTGTAIEINGCANLANPRYDQDYVREYVEYLGVMAEEGAIFSLASDAHDIHRLAGVVSAWNAAEELGLSASQIWRPSGPPLVGGITSGQNIA